MINPNRLHFCFMVAVVIVSSSNAMEGNDDSSPHMFNMNEQPPLDLLDPAVFDNALGGQASQGRRRRLHQDVGPSGEEEIESSMDEIKDVGLECPEAYVG